MSAAAQARFLGPFAVLPPVVVEQGDGREFALVGTQPRTIAGFAIERQNYSNWCWAAVAAGVARTLKGGATDQFAVARAIQGNQYPANVPGYLQPALAAERVDWGGPWGGFDFNPGTFVQYLQPEIDAGRPVCMQVSYANGYSHFMALYGYSIASPSLVYVYWQDPGDANPAQSYHGLELSRTKYPLPGGTWDQIYFTRSH